jgi:CubicO group peptidase (beta-lactamase class C family)
LCIFYNSAFFIFEKGRTMGVSTEAAGFSPEALAKVPPILASSVESGDTPGVISLIWRKREVVQVAAAGLRDIERRLPMERSTIFRIASMTKPVTVCAALTLVEEGRMRLDDPIAKWAPEFAAMRVLKHADGPLDDTYPSPRPITIEDLMTHRSGLAYSFTSSGPLARALEDQIGFGIDSPLTPDAWMKTLAALPLSFAPGERFNYGLSIDVLGLIVGRAAGASLREAMYERVCGPLGMNDTDFWIPPEKRDRAAVPYAAGEALGSFTPAHPAAFIGDAPQAFLSGGQGLVSTADDYLTFARLLLGEGEVGGVRLLKPETVRMMTTNRLSDAQRAMPFMGLPFWAGQGFGLGLSVITDAEKQAWMGAGSNGAFGWPGMYGGWWQADPIEDLILIWLTQVTPPAPTPGAPPSMPRMPGLLAKMAFQNQAYQALNR